MRLQSLFSISVHWVSTHVCLCPSVFLTVPHLHTQALDEEMSDQDVDDMIAEIDEDSSGTVDYEEFKAVMHGGSDE